MTPEEFRSLGEKLGYGWQTRLAADIRVSTRSIRRWLAGKRDIRPPMEKLIRQWFAEQGLDAGVSEPIREKDGL